MEGVSIDLHVSTDWHVSWSQSLSLLVNILVLSALEEFTWDDAGVLLGWLVDGDAVIAQVEGDDEASVNVLWHTGVKSCSESQDVLIVVHSLEEVDLGLLWDETVHLSKGINLVSKSVVRRLLDLSLLWYIWQGNVSKWEIISICLAVPSLGELINTFNLIDSSIGIDVANWSDFISSHIVVSNELLAWLVHSEFIWELLSSQEEWEGITTIIWVVDFTDLYCIVSQIVMHYKLETL